MSRLAVLDSHTRTLAPCSMLQLFRSHADYVRLLDASPRLRVLLLRHLTPLQANQLLSLPGAPEAPKPAAPLAPVAEGEEGAEGEEVGWQALGQDVRSLREEVLESEVEALAVDEPRFAELLKYWRQPAVAAKAGLPDVLSTKVRVGA